MLRHGMLRNISKNRHGLAYANTAQIRQMLRHICVGSSMCSSVVPETINEQITCYVDWRNPGRNPKLEIDALDSSTRGPHDMTHPPQLLSRCPWRTFLLSRGVVRNTVTTSELQQSHLLQTCRSSAVRLLLRNLRNQLIAPTLEFRHHAVIFDDSPENEQAA